MQFTSNRDERQSTDLPTIGGFLGYSGPGARRGTLEELNSSAELKSRVDEIVEGAVRAKLRQFEYNALSRMPRGANGGRSPRRHTHRGATATRAGPDGDDPPPAEPPGELEIASSEFQEAA